MRRWPRLLSRALAIAIALAAPCPSGSALASAAGTPAPVGGPLLDAVGAEAVWLGRIEGVRQVDRHGWAASLRVERALRGDVPESGSAAIGWEELAPERPVRFADGQRVLIALDPMPSYSLWRQRFPDGGVMAVAGRGGAFLRDPDAETLRLLAAAFAVPADAWSGARGARALAALVEGAEPGLALAAVARLRARSDLVAQLDAAANASLANALGDPSRPAALRREIAVTAGAQRLAALRPALVRQSQPGDPLEASMLAALAEIDGGLEPAQVERLIASERPELRAIGVRWAGGTPSEAGVRERITGDPDPRVRAAAAVGWIRWRGLSGLPDVEPALQDADRRVRAEAARAVGGLGEPVVPRMTELIVDRSPDEALGPIAALYFAGPAGRARLEELARTHQNEDVRKLIHLTLGQAPPH